LDELHADGQSIPAETNRLGHASAELQRKAAAFLREIGGPRVLQNSRQARQADAAAWWWSVDRWLVDKRKARLQRWLVTGGLLVLLLAILSLVYQRFFAPDPALLASVRHQQTAESLAQAEDWAGALAEAEQALAALPGDPERLILKGILQQKLGKNESAEKTFDTAEAHLGSREAFLIERAAQFLGINMGEAALTDAQELIAIQPDSAIGYLILGQSHISLENYDEARTALEQASDLAERQGTATIAAQARVQLAMLMQMISVPTLANP
jgi:tetratricopeptide (TPR) repeat protein